MITIALLIAYSNGSTHYSARLQDWGVPAPMPKQMVKPFKRFDRTLDKLTDYVNAKGTGTVKIDDADVSPILLSSQLREALDWIKVSARNNSSKPVPQGYIQSLQSDMDLLDKVTSKPTLDQQGARILKSVADDIDTKNKFCQSHGGVGLVLTNVSVETKDGSVDVPGCTVWFVPAGWYDDPDRKHHISKMRKNSCPALDSLAPGNYYMWTQLKNKLGTPVPVTILAPPDKNDFACDIVAP